MQYAHWHAMEKTLIIDAMEHAMFCQWLELEGDDKMAPADWIVDQERDESKFSLKLVYGSYMPQPGTSMAQAKIDAVARLGAWHGSIRRRECHRLELCDLEMGEPVGSEDNFKMPIAALIASKIEVRKGSFALTAFVRYANISPLDNILNRPGLYALKTQENRRTKGITRDNWRALIDRERMLRIGSKSECNRGCGCGSAH